VLYNQTILISAISSIIYYYFSAKNRRLERYLPSSWDKYFEATEDVTINSNRFKVYRRGSDGPLLYLIHGGGHSSLSWCVFAVCYIDIVMVTVICDV
jgi:protein phosphatase methylesterase 1